MLDGNGVPSRTRIKICGFTRAEDVSVAVQMGVDAIGLVFYPPSPRFVDVPKALEIISQIPAFVSVVGLFVDAQREEIEAILDKVPMDLLQFHGSENAQFCQSFQRPYLKAVAMGGGVELAALVTQYTSAAGLLLDSHAPGAMGGSGQTFDWQSIPQSIGPKIILAGGLDPGNVRTAIEQVQPYAVDVSSGVEQSKGIKDAAKMAAFIREVNSV